MAIRLIAFLSLLTSLSAFTNPIRPLTDEVFYFIVTDRFENADPSNDRGDFIPKTASSEDSKEDILTHGYWPQNKGYYHGGDFAGIMKRLPYLKQMGITAIWLSPIQKNRPIQGDGTLEGSSSAYHGYWIEDFTTVDPHLGTEEEFSNLVKKAHSLGMKVFMDIITNHTADVIQYKECGACVYLSRADYPYSTETINPDFNEFDLSYENFEDFISYDYAYTPFLAEGDEHAKKPDWLNDIKYYHNRGETTFTGEDSLLGDFFGLDDLYTENPRVLDGMIEIQKEWIKKYRIDGFRVDTVRHVNMEFWQKFVPELVEYAKDLGIPNFTMFGEVYDPNPRNLSPFIREGKFPTLLDFAFQNAVEQMITSNNKNALQNKLVLDDLYRKGGNPQNMVNFVSNHDMGRLARLLPKDNQKLSLQKLKLAHGLMFFARGVPVIYYGDEQGFTGDGGDKDAREDMFPSLVESYNDNTIIGYDQNTSESNFNTDHPLFETIRKYADIYKQHELLRSGEQEFVRSNNSNLLIFSRSLFHAKDEYLIVSNMSNTAQQYKLPSYKSDLIYSNGIKIKQTVSIPAWDFVLVRNPKVYQKVSSAQFTKPASKVLPSGEMHFQVDIKGNRWNKVRFAITNTATGKTIMLPTDYNRPYQAFYEDKSIQSGTQLIAYALIEDSTGQKKRIKQRFTVDSRNPEVIVHYENGNNRESATHFVPGNQINISKPLIDDKYHFSWPLNQDRSYLVFSTSNDSGTSLDETIELNYTNDIEPYLKSTSQALIAEIYINNKHEVSHKEHNTPLVKPKALPEDSQAEPFGETSIYLKGAMNNWLNDDPMPFSSAYSYNVQVFLNQGSTDFKFSDADWSAAYNFGGPYTQNGLTRSDSSQNLFVNTDSEGLYRFTLNYYPAGSISSNTADLLIPIITPEN